MDSGRLRRLVVLRGLGFPQEEIAALLEISQQTVSRHLALIHEVALRGDPDALHAQLASPPPVPAAAWLHAKVGGWANMLAARFGAPVWLVGSALREPLPRDVDVRVVLAEEDFRARYGEPGAWAEDAHSPAWGPARRAWARDVGKLSHDAAVRLGVNIDFQVEPAAYAQRWHAGKERRRLDSVDVSDPLARA